VTGVYFTRYDDVTHHVHLGGHVLGAVDAPTETRRDWRAWDSRGSELGLHPTEEDAVAAVVAVRRRELGKMAEYPWPDGAWESLPPYQTHACWAGDHAHCGVCPGHCACQCHQEDKSRPGKAGTGETPTPPRRKR
jgi:hypothetical protein